jgi:hypothetical protein
MAFYSDCHSVVRAGLSAGATASRLLGAEAEFATQACGFA